MALSCVNLDPDLPDHPKLVELEGQVGPIALTHLVKLWCWAYKYAPDGDLSKYKNPDYLERQVMGWKGDSGVLFKSLLKIGWLERGAHGKLLIHDFFERNQHVIVFRKAQSARAKQRWGSRENGVGKTEQLSQATVGEGDNFMPDAVSEGGRHMPRHSTTNAPLHHHHQSLTDPKRSSPLPPKGGDGDEVSLKTLFDKHQQTFGSYPTPTQQSEYQLRLSEFGASASAWNKAFRKAGVAGAKTPEYVFRCMQSSGRAKAAQDMVGNIGRRIQ